MMTMRCGALILLGLWTAVVGRAAVELSAYLQVGGQSKFVLTDLDDRATSNWIGLGQSFHGYLLIAYDAGRESLTVRQGGRTFEVALRGSQVLPVAASALDEAAARGITPADLIVRDGGPVRIRLVVGAQEKPVARRFIDVKFDNGTDRAGVQFGTEGPQAISRSFVPEAVRDSGTDADLAAINAHLATVRGKWLPP